MKQLEAVIEIGSTGIRMLVAEVGNGTWDIIDHAELPVALGRDVFNSGIMSRETLLQCLHILRRIVYGRFHGVHLLSAAIISRIF